MANITIKRIYEKPAEGDGYRVLVDRLWPRGISKERAAFDDWLKDVAPSPELRTWFNHDPAKFTEFSARYESELAENPAVQQLKDIAQEQGTVTLLYAAHDPAVNHALVLQKYLTTS